jgi:hypothetical protein
MAFEEFKTERGNEINRIWNENKGDIFKFIEYKIYIIKKITNLKITDILASKRRQYSDLAHKINETKSLIDHTRVQVENKRAERMAMGMKLNYLYYV